MWNRIEIILNIREKLESHSEILSTNQSHFGIDSFNELQLHPLIAQSFSSTNHTVLREVEYPSSKLDRPNDNQRLRCDLVITPGPNQSIIDPIDELRIQDSASHTLFAHIADQHEHKEHEIWPSEAFWLEVKSIGQTHYPDGIPNPNSKYAHDLLSGPKADVIKIASDSKINAGAVLVVLFNELEEAGRHDCMLSVENMLNLGIPITTPEFEHFQIPDHGGNAWCTLAIIPVNL